MATSLGDQGVIMFQIDSFQRSFSPRLILSTSLSCTSSFYVSLTSTSVNLTAIWAYMYEQVQLVEVRVKRCDSWCVFQHLASMLTLSTS